MTEVKEVSSQESDSSKDGDGEIRTHESAVVANPYRSLDMSRDRMIDNVSLPFPFQYMPQCKEPEPPGRLLMIPELANHVLRYLEWDDLKACFDVCKLWRQLVPAHIPRARANMEPVIIDVSNPADGFHYLSALRRDPVFKLSKFSFRNADLLSPAVQELLRINAEDMEQLELCYSSGLGRWRGQRMETLTASEFQEFILTKTPNLKTLAIKELPFHIIRADLFGANQPGAQGQLALSKIDVSIDFIKRVPRWTPVTPNHPSNGYKEEFLIGLFKLSPQLQDIAVIGGEPSARGRVADYNASKIFQALVQANRLAHIRKISIDYADRGSMQVLNNDMAPGQLRSLTIRQIWPVLEPEDDYEDLYRFLSRQRSSLEYVNALFDRFRLVTWSLPPMPKLAELRIMKDPHSFRSPNAPPRRALNYSLLRSLRVLSLNGFLENYNVDEIYPEDGPPCSSVRVLKEIPVGVDQVIMARIGRLFPNLTIIRIRKPIPYEHERLLISIWEFCPNITELFLTLTLGSDSEATNNEEQERVGLDSLFSGIPEPECKRLRGISIQEQKLELATMDFQVFQNLRGGSPSICDLKNLRRLCINVPEVPGPRLNGNGNDVRSDHLSNVFGYSTLAALDPELIFFQVHLGLISLTSACVDHICRLTGLQHIVRGQHGFHRDFGRLIRPRYGLQALGPELPREWFGREDQNYEVVETRTRVMIPHALN